VRREIGAGAAIPGIEGDSRMDQPVAPLTLITRMTDGQWPHPGGTFHLTLMVRGSR
jgi:hypothetical protein